MAHDQNTIHVSHYKGSPTWRSAVSPEDRSWLLFIDVTGAPHLYLATETQDGDGQTCTTYAPCVRAMLRIEDAPIIAPLNLADTFTITMRHDPDDRAHPYHARCGNALARPGKTKKEAVSEALEEFFRDSDPALGEGVAALAL